MSVDSNLAGNSGPGDADLPTTTPRDVRLLHLILASMGVTAYQDRVPLQLMDFAFRYTNEVLQDALHYSDHAHSTTSHQPAGVGPSNVPLTIDDVRLAVGARVNYQFKPAPPKELLLDLAQERNKRPLPQVTQQYGIRLPPEKYCLTSKEWEFDDEDDELMTELVDGTVPTKSTPTSVTNRDDDSEDDISMTDD